MSVVVKRLIGAVLLLAGLWTLAGCERAVRDEPSQGEQASSAQEKDAGDVRILMLGCDRAASLTDSILLLSVNPQTADVRILQIPRDTYADYTERDYKKLNGAYNTLGADGVRDFLSHALGIRIDYTAVYDLDCVRRAVDAVGGVELEVPQPMHYTDPVQGLEIDLPAGKQRLDGEKAEQFVRFRSGYADADLGRLNAQKLFLEAFLQALRQLPPARLTPVCLALLPQVRTDLPPTDAVRLALAFLRADEPSLRMRTAPGEPAKGVSGAWYYVLNRAGMEAALAEWSENAYAEFDPDGVFDRTLHPEFHRIYTAPDRGS